MKGGLEGLVWWRAAGRRMMRVSFRFTKDSNAEQSEDMFVGLRQSDARKKDKAKRSIKSIWEVRQVHVRGPFRQVTSNRSKMLKSLRALPSHLIKAFA